MARRKNIGFDLREAQRQALVLHACLLTFGLLACALANRMFSPERLWVHWVALVWGGLFLAHLAHFYRTTLAGLRWRA
jgi:hypothetical protein